MYINLHCNFNRTKYVFSNLETVISEKEITKNYNKIT